MVRVVSEQMEKVWEEQEKPSQR